MPSKLYVTFLDLLGFSNHSLDDTETAIHSMTNYVNTIQNRISDNATHPLHTIEDERIKKLNEERYSTAFKYFIPFSDSIFIGGEDPDLFINQIATFLLDSLYLTLAFYGQPKDESEPTKVDFTLIKRDENGRIVYEEEEQRWPPTLFRGGISYGNLQRVKLPAINDYKAIEMPGLVGEAVVKAVRMEQTKLKGPRVFIGEDIVKSINDETKKMILATSIPGVFELLWLAKLYIDSNNDSDLWHFSDIFYPAMRFWNAYKNKSFGLHYYELIRLLINSTMSFYQNIGLETKARRYIEDRLEDAKLINQKHDLFSSFDSQMGR